MKKDKSLDNEPLELNIKEAAAVYTKRLKGNLYKKKTRYKLIDTFCGAGGMSLGFSPKFNHNFQPVWANDFNKYCVDTYNANFGNHCVAGDIIEILDDKKTVIPKADVVIGGPPCQGFSLLNKKRKNDPRNQLWRQYLRIVEMSKAKIFVMENVPQLLDSAEYHEIVGKAEELGFKIQSAVLLAADYGVPQLRRRAFIIGCRHMDPKYFFPPYKTHYNPKDEGKHHRIDDGYLPHAKRWRTVRDAIGDLKDPVGTEIRAVDPPNNLQFGRNPTAKSLARYKAVPDEGMNRFDLLKNARELTPDCWIRKKTGSTDLFGRMWWDRPSLTIRTEFFKPEKGRYLHPSSHRPITHREAARIQSFPDDFDFKGTKIEVARQIGNAVPPVLAARVADMVYHLLERS